MTSFRVVIVPRFYGRDLIEINDGAAAPKLRLLRSRDEARRIAVNIAKLPTLLGAQTDSGTAQE